MLGMTRKHFEAFASIIQSTREQCSDAPETVWAIDHIRDEMADYFQGENPNFDRERFMQACEEEN